MFKKIMAVALTAVMAVSMLTGCALTDAVRDKAVEKALESKLSGNGVEVKVSTTDAKEYTDVVKAVKQELDANKDKVPTEVVITATKGYVAVVVKASNKSNNVKNDLKDADVDLLKTCLTDETKDSAKLKIATDYFKGLKETGKTDKCDYVIIVAKVAA